MFLKSKDKIIYFSWLIKYHNYHYRLKKSQHGTPVGTIQRPSRGSGGDGDQRINRSSISNPPSRLNQNLDNSQLQRSHEPTTVSSSLQKENISTKSRSITTKEFDLMENDFLHEELVKAVKTHFQENLNWQKNSNKVALDKSSKHSKDDSSDDDIEGT